MKRSRPGDEGKETSFVVRTQDSPLSLDEHRQLPRHPIHLVLDNLRSAFNVGSIFRSGDTARIASICTCGYTAHPPHPKLEKTALGTVECVPSRHFDLTEAAVAHLQGEGVPVWALETTSASIDYADTQFPKPVAVVLGNEALGIGRPVLERCDRLIQIPTYGFKNSLNVASAAAVVLFEILRQWGAANSP